MKNNTSKMQNAGRHVKGELGINSRMWQNTPKHKSAFHSQ